MSVGVAALLAAAVAAGAAAAGSTAARSSLEQTRRTDPTAAAAQDDQGLTMEERRELMRVAAEVMRAAGNCALITIDASGHPQARAMDPFPPEDDLTVWMATNRTTRKVAEMAEDPRVTLYYFDPAGPSYVTLRGEASIIEDPVQRERFWKPEWDAFYVDGNRGADYALIRFTPDRAEIVSVPHGVASDPMAWRPAILELR